MNPINPSPSDVEATAFASRSGIDALTVVIFMLPTALGVFMFIPSIKAMQVARETGEVVSPYSVPPVVTTSFSVACCLLGLAAVAALCWWTFKTNKAAPASEQ